VESYIRIMRLTRSPLSTALLAAVCLAGCAPRQPPESIPAADPDGVRSATGTTMPAGPVVDPRIDDLYAELAAAADAYESGIELIVLGEEVDGESRIANATARLTALAAECDALDGCDLRRLIAAFDRLLERQSLALKQQAYRIEELQRNAERDVEREPGTSPFVVAMPEVGETVSMLHGSELREIIELKRKPAARSTPTLGRGPPVRCSSCVAPGSATVCASSTVSTRGSTPPRRPVPTWSTSTINSPR